ncbi:MAG TPA: glycoside hydrolase family 15 protein [Casimicrobiaceae bacterium]|nr:glycoside hydrolase family 15 protein [Casimicrobiaceae bacterium]
MPLRIEDYALIGDTATAALVGNDGSIDWFCAPRFDAPALFAALLGTPAHGRWLIAPAASPRKVRRRYRDRTLILHTEFETDEGAVRLVDCMPVIEGRTDIVRIVEGLRGSVRMSMELVMRPGYGAIIPWVRRVDRALIATAGPTSVEFRTPVETSGRDFTTVADFTVGEGQRIPFVLSCFESHKPRPLPIEADAAVDVSEAYWRRWSRRCGYRGRWSDAVYDSLVILKALMHAPTGGMVAAATTSLPERIGGVRNWDYRFCWVRDATFTLYALLLAGYREEARAWREWLLRAAAGHPEQLQVLYGVDGERQIAELELPWLPGYQDSAPVRIGNAAAAQFQLDIYGELLDALHVARTAGLAPDADAWALQRALTDYVCEQWTQPDCGMWEVRGPPRHFTHSKVMAWVALDRSIRAIESRDVEGPLDRWRDLRQRIHDEVCAKGVDATRGVFVQHYGATGVDASALLIPIVGFLPFDDPRVRATVEAIERELTSDGFVLRYRTEENVDGLPPGEGVFLPCSFWLADNLAQVGRVAEAEALFERLLALRNDVGLLSEEYDPRERRFLGNLPQAMTHVAIVNTARNLTQPGGPSEHRGQLGDVEPPGGVANPPDAKAPFDVASSG